MRHLLLDYCSSIGSIPLAFCSLKSKSADAIVEFQFFLARPITCPIFELLWGLAPILHPKARTFKNG